MQHRAAGGLVAADYGRTALPTASASWLVPTLPPQPLTYSSCLTIRYLLDCSVLPFPVRLRDSVDFAGLPASYV